MDSPKLTHTVSRAGFNLRRIRERLGWSRQELASRYGCDKSYITILEKGYRPIGNQTRKKLAQILGVDEAEFFRDPEALDLEERPVPVFDASAGPPMQFTDQGYPVGHSDEFILASTRDSHAFWVRMHGDSMTGSGIDDGDTVLVEPHRQVENGDIVFFRLRDEVGVKKFHRRGNSVVLQPTNPAYEPIVLTDPGDIEALTCFVAVEVRKRLNRNRKPA